MDKVKRDAAYDYIRVTAMLAITLCHFFQVRNCYVAFSWLNIGVQVFFVLSARLLCKKELKTWHQIFAFYRSRVLRLLLPVWIYLLCLVPVLFVVGRSPALSAVVLYAVGMAGFAPSGVLGLGHFWYITVLLLCYLLVPVLDRIEYITRQMSDLKGFVLKAIPAVVVVLLFAMTPWIYFGVNMALFIIAYFYFRTVGNDTRWSRTLTLRLLPFAAVAIGVRIYLDDLAGTDVQLYELASTAAKAILGMFLFGLLYLLFSSVAKNRIWRGLFLLSGASYEVYIVHQFVLLALYEFVPFFQRDGLLSGLVLLGTSFILISANTAVLYFAKTKTEWMMRSCIHHG